MLRRSGIEGFRFVAPNAIATRFAAAGGSVRRLGGTERKHFTTDNKKTKELKELSYPGAKIELTNELQFVQHFPLIPTFRVIDKQGKVTSPKHDPKLPKETALKIFSTMVKLSIVDNILYESQRQGRISFYMPSFGEEAATVASAAALDATDEIYAQYREQGALMWRGFTIEQMIDQCYSNEVDLGKGRQMPVHYGSKDIHVQTISSPLATQIPQAAGLAYALKRSGEKRICICYFGEGAASEGDFHAGLNFAATLKAPVIFFCRNNGWAISTPSSEQYAGDGIAVRGPAYGIKTLRVDGNDALAVYAAVAKARQIALEGEPVLIEAMTYRVGHHSTSDDSTRYRPTEEVQYWQNNESPITRLRKYLESKGWWNAEQESQLVEATRAEVLQFLKKGEQRHKPPISDLFNDVYESLPPHLQNQKQQLLEHLHKYADDYRAVVEEFAVEPKK